MSRNPVQKAVMHIYSNARDLAEVALATKIIKMAACIHKEAGKFTTVRHRWTNHLFTTCSWEPREAMASRRELLAMNKLLRLKLQTCRHERDMALQRIEILVGEDGDPRQFIEEIVTLRSEAKEVSDRQKALEQENRELKLEIADLKETHRGELELARRQAVEDVEREAKSREERLEATITDLREQLAHRPEPLDEPPVEEPADESSRPTDGGEDRSTSETTPKTVPSSEETGDNTVPLAQQLQLIEKFSGVNANDRAESFKDWLEQFEVIADAFGWSQRVRLIGLTTRLKGPALDYYRTCPPESKETYKKLKESLSSCFVPVRLQAVQSCQFSERKQLAGESVDVYAQDLRRLFSLAYPDAVKDASPEGKMGRLVLASQFVAGLRTELKEKLAGVEGDIDQLLVKARFEEAKRRELHLDQEESKRAKPGDSANTVRMGSGRSRTLKPHSDHSTNVRGRGKDMSQIVCHHCGGKGHMQRSCPLKGRTEPVEASGKRDSKEVKELTASRKDALEEELAELKTLGVCARAGELAIGPRVEVEVLVDGLPVKALVDTGSPVTILSSSCFFQIHKSQTPEGEDWKERVRAARRKPSIGLKAYDKGRVQVDAETNVTLSRGRHSVTATVLVQCEAPQTLLLGTDLMGALGIKINLDPCEPVESREDSKEVSVKLIQPVRIPARHTRIVRAELECGAMDRDTLMLVESPTMKPGFSIEATLVEPSPEGVITLAVRNEGLHPIILERNQVMGCAEAVEMIDSSEMDKASVSAETVNALSVSTELTEERRCKLCAALRMDKTPLTLEQRDQMVAMLLKYHNTFALDESELGMTHCTQHRIETGDSAPIRQYARRIPYSMRSQVASLTEDMLRREVIRPSTSPWASPIVLVKKRDGTYRFCVDYRRLNAVTKSDTFPLPRIDDYLDVLAGAQYFTTLDLASGYWQVAMEPQSVEKTAFVTHAGAYEFLVMPFGLKNAPATFQRLMGEVLAGLPQSVCLDYIDDILVIGVTFEEHLSNLEEVLQRLQRAGLKLKPSKCTLAKEEVTYLGYVVSSKGVHTDPRKVQAVQEFPVPENVTQLRSFVGLTSYYRRFIQNYARTARPLHALTGKSQKFT